MKARKLQAKQKTDPEAADDNDVCDAVPRHPLPAVHMTYVTPSAPFPVNSYYIRDGPRHPLPDNPMTYGTSNVHSYNIRSKLCRPQWVTAVEHSYRNGSRPGGDRGGYRGQKNKASLDLQGRQRSCGCDGEDGRVAEAGLRQAARSATVIRCQVASQKNPPTNVQIRVPQHHSQRYGSMKSPWWLDDNVQTYMELMRARELQEKLRKRSRTTKRTRPIDRTSEKHDLGVQHKDRHIRLKRKAKLTAKQRSGKSVNRRNRAR